MIFIDFSLLILWLYAPRRWCQGGWPIGKRLASSADIETRTLGVILLFCQLFHPVRNIESQIDVVDRPALAKAKAPPISRMAWTGITSARTRPTRRCG
jgi:hypothetical protein